MRALLQDPPEEGLNKDISANLVPEADRHRRIRANDRTAESEFGSFGFEALLDGTFGAQNRRGKQGKVFVHCHFN
jgi:hypothetical protein